MERVRIAISLDREDNPVQVALSWYGPFHELEGVQVIPVGPFDNLALLAGEFVDEFWECAGIESRGVQLTLGFD